MVACFHLLLHKGVLQSYILFYLILITVRKKNNDASFWCHQLLTEWLYQIWTLAYETVRWWMMQFDRVTSSDWSCYSNRVCGQSGTEWPPEKEGELAGYIGKGSHTREEKKREKRGDRKVHTIKWWKEVEKARRRVFDHYRTISASSKRIECSALPNNDEGVVRYWIGRLSLSLVFRSLVYPPVRLISSVYEESVS